MKFKLMLVGEHPMSTTGNGHMMSQLIERIDRSKYEISVFTMTHRMIISNDLFAPVDYSIIEGANTQDTTAWTQTLGSVLSTRGVDIVMFVGIDIYHYAPILPYLRQLRASRAFTVIGLFPYDLISLRKDWCEWINMMDIPCVYSKFGYNMLKGHVNNLHYFRPPLFEAHKFRPYTHKEKEQTRARLFSNYVEPDAFVFSIIGANQIRKDPQRAIRAFFNMRKRVPKAVLYLHMEIGYGEFNIARYLKDCGMDASDPCVLVKKQAHSYTTDAMVDVYNAIDCLVNTSYQEGLSWTIVEAMLCGTPIIAANNTAHIELLEGAAGYRIECNQLAYIPVCCKGDEEFPVLKTSVETYACDPEQLENAMYEVAIDPKLRSILSSNGIKRGKEWIAGVSDINELLDEGVKKAYNRGSELQKKVLFAQHSAAGDVLMTTRCLRGLRERHGNIPLVYMTSKQYMDILKNNPYVDEIIEWDDAMLHGHYEFVYNPHGERILPGHWGRNSNSLLSDFYWKILGVVPNDFVIEQLRPDEEIAKAIEHADRPICILHTTGGDAQFRTYKYMGDVAWSIHERYLTVQLGGKNDYPAEAEIDLRGKLSFRETAWVMARAAIAITVDSFISHLAGALGVSQVCLFGSGNHQVVRPNPMKRAVLICMAPDYVRDCPGLGPCSAAVRDCPLPCTGIHKPDDIVANIVRLEKEMTK